MLKKSYSVKNKPLLFHFKNFKLHFLQNQLMDELHVNGFEFFEVLKLNQH